MVKVPEYTPNVAIRPELQSNMTVRANAEQMGAGIGRGLQGLSRGLQQASNAFAELKALEDTTAAKDADVEYANWTREQMYGEGGFLTLQGKNAIDARAAFEKSAEEKRRELSKGLTPGANAKYNQMTQARLERTLQQSIVHTAGQRKTWVNEAATARMNSYANDALVNYSNQDLVKDNIAAGLAELNQQAALNGWSPEKKQDAIGQFVSGVHRNVALRIAQDDPLAARDYINEMAGELSGADQFALKKAIEPIAQEAEATSFAADILSGGRDEVSTPDHDHKDDAPAVRAPAKKFLMSRLASGHGAEHIEGLDDTFAGNLSAMFQDAPPHIRDGLGVYSGFRSVERQRQLWENALKKYGSPEAARKWVAPPGKSNHNHGDAADISYNGRSLKHAPKEVIKWVHDNAAAYGLKFPMSWEPWHIEDAGTRGGAPVGTTAVATSNTAGARLGFPSYDQIEARLAEIKDPAVRELARKRINSAMAAQSKAIEQRQKSAKAELWSYIDQGYSPDDVPMDIRQAAGMSAVSSAWGYMETVASGREVKTDDVFLYDMKRFAAMEPEQFASLDLNDYRDRLGKGDFQKMSDAQTSILKDERKAREEGLQLTSAWSQASDQLEAVGLTTTGKKGREREEIARQVSQFQSALADEMASFKEQNGKAPTQYEIQSMVNRMLLPIVTKGPANFIGGRDQKEGFFFETGKIGDIGGGFDVELNVKYDTIPIVDRLEIEQTLEAQLGHKPSAAQVEEVYERFLMEQRE